MAQLVGDDGEDLAVVDARLPVDEVVVDDHPAGRAEAGHVGVERGRAPRRVGHQHVVDVHALLVGQREDLGAERAVRQRLEVVEQGLDQQRVDERAEHHQSGQQHARRRRARRAATGARRRRAPPARSRWPPPRPRGPWPGRRRTPPQAWFVRPNSSARCRSTIENGRVASRPTTASADDRDDDPPPPGPAHPVHQPGAEPAEPQHARDRQRDRQRRPAEQPLGPRVVLGALDLLGREHRGRRRRVQRPAGDRVPRDQQHRDDHEGEGPDDRHAGGDASALGSTTVSLAAGP